MFFAAFLIAQYHATPLSHSRKRLRLRVCFWLAPFAMLRIATHRKPVPPFG
jgi:hypothetical protein